LENTGQKTYKKNRKYTN